MAGCDTGVVAASTDVDCLATPTPRSARDEGETVLASDCGPGGDTARWDGGGKTAVTGRLPLADLAVALVVAGLAPVPGVLGAWASLGERSSGVCRGGLWGDKET